VTTKPKGDPWEKYPKKKCPRCGQQGVLCKRSVMNKISRLDNKTELCQQCGTEEAFGGLLAEWHDDKAGRKAITAFEKRQAGRKRVTP
jgi:ribosomal protein S27AE